MATVFPATLSTNHQSRLHLAQSPPPFSFSSYSRSSSSSSSSCSLLLCINSRKHLKSQYKGFRVECSSVREPLKVMISGAPASGKGTQCKLIVEKYGLVHISTGDLLRAEVSSKTEIGKKAKEYMDNGKLVPDQIVTDMVVARLSRQDASEKGWLLDGYPRSYSQAQSLESMKIRPDIYIILEVPDEILIDRCVGRRLDPVTGKIYHTKNFPPENKEIASRLITRSDDTLEKAKSRLETYKQNAEAILPTYMDLLNKIDGNRERDAVFQDVDSLLQKVNENHSNSVKVAKTNENASINITKVTPKNVKWRGIPTRLNNVPHSREIREYFYEDIRNATNKAVYDRKTRLKVEINIPELNPELDVYRIGTLMEMVRNLAFSFSDDGKRVKVCVQGAMGEGSFAGIPMQLAGTRKILEYMDWGEDGALGDFINIGAIGAEEVNEKDDIFILVAPQNAVGNCIIDDLQAMMEAAGDRPVILINPQLKDLPSSSGVMTTIGREDRMKFAASFETCYSFRLLYYAGSFFPIMGAQRRCYPSGYELYRRIDGPSGKEEYVILAEFPNKPTSIEINDAFTGRKRNKEQGIWGFLSGIF